MKLDTATSEQKDHAEFSASGAARWLGCPGSIALSKKAPPQRESEYAREGTEAHACFEFLLKNRNKLEAAVKSARKKYDADMVEHGLAATRWVCDQVKDPSDVVLSETRVDSSPFTCSGQFGTLDAAVVREFERLTVIDYKYGAGVAVSPEGENGEGNPQLVYYALALSHQYHHNFSEVELVVIQPRAYHESGETIRTVILPIETLLSWGERFRNGVMETSDPKAPLKAGSWCKFCPAATICPELKENAMQSAQIVFDDERGLESVPEPKMIQLPHLGTILDACDRLEDWIGKVREHAYHVLERGNDVPGWKLVQRRGIRKWIDEESAAAEAKEHFGKSAFAKPKLLSPAQFEKLSPAASKWVETRAKAESSGTTLARETDKRPAVRPLEVVFGDALANTLPAAVKQLPATRKKP